MSKLLLKHFAVDSNKEQQTVIATFCIGHI